MPRTTQGKEKTTNTPKRKRSGPGRPRINEDSLSPKTNAIKPISEGGVRGSLRAPIYRKHWEHIYKPPVLAKSGPISDEEDSDFDLRDLYSLRSRYTPEDKLFAVTAFVVTGSLIEAAKLSGVKYPTLKDWKQKAIWWEDTVQEIRKRKQEELDGEMTNILHKSVAEIKDRIENGNTVLNKKGVQEKVPMPSRDLLYVMAMTYEKRALIRGDPTSRTERTSTDAQLDKLTKKLEATYAKLRNQATKLPPNEEGDVFDAERVEKQIKGPDQEVETD